MTLLTYGQAFQKVQPRWSRLMLWLVGIPAWFTFGTSILMQPMPLWGLGAFFIFGAVCAVQWVIYLSRKQAND